MSGIMHPIPLNHGAMNVQEVLNVADRLVFAKTGKHIDTLQEAILRGTLEGETYGTISHRAHCSEGHARDVGAKLWKILSDALGEPVTKSNLRSTLDRFEFSHPSNLRDFVQISKFSTCAESPHPAEIPYPASNPTSTGEEAMEKPKSVRDLAEMPDMAVFYGREAELATLKQWILYERTRLLLLRGLSGIGKTALAVQLVQQVMGEFDAVVWRSLRRSPSLEGLSDSLIRGLSRLNLFGANTATPTETGAGELAGSVSNTLYTKNSDRTSMLFPYLRQARCLIILDDIHCILAESEFAGKYRSGYENYGVFFQQLAELSHHSCLLLLGWEPPREIPALKGKNAPVRGLQLGSLGAAAQNILRDKGLVEMENAAALIEAYQGNPLWLKIVATMIQDLFDGSVAEFFRYEPRCLGEDLRAVLDRQYRRLSEAEKTVILALATESYAVSVGQFVESKTGSFRGVFNALQSLERRCWIEKSRSQFFLVPMLKHYVQTETSQPLI